MILLSSSFAAGQPIPLRHTGDGVNVSPPLSWDGVPPGTRSLALICDDPDAPKKAWVHWVLYCLPPTLLDLPEGVPTTPTLPDGSAQGRNDFGAVGYGGPAPPKGPPHRYVFKLYALDNMPTLPPGATRQEVLDAMGTVLAETELMGTYQR
jgi:Raf kinase inhibitor-like YbhB/YbcL family protein